MLCWLSKADRRQSRLILRLGLEDQSRVKGKAGFGLDRNFQVARLLYDCEDRQGGDRC